MTKHDIELDLAPHIDPTWTEAFILEARLREVPGKVIGDALGEVDDHCTSSGETAEEAFGPARHYAAAVAAGSEPVAGPNVNWVLAPTFLQVAGVLVGLDGVTGLVRDDAHPLSWGTFAVGLLAPIVARVFSWALRFLVHRPVLGALCLGALFALVMLGAVLLGRLDAPRVGLHAWTVLFLGVGILLLGTAADLWASRLPSVHDPLVVAGATPSDVRPRIRLMNFYGVLCFAVGAGVIMLVGTP